MKYNPSLPLTSPFRLSLIERVLKNDPYFQSRMGAKTTVTNRRKQRRRCSSLSFAVAAHMASLNEDPARALKERIIARAFEYVQALHEIRAARNPRRKVPVHQIEFYEGGNTLWVHSPHGTVLRIKCSGKIVVQRECANKVPHSDINVRGNIDMCFP